MNQALFTFMILILGAPSLLALPGLLRIQGSHHEVSAPDAERVLKRGRGFVVQYRGRFYGVTASHVSAGYRSQDETEPVIVWSGQRRWKVGGRLISPEYDIEVFALSDYTGPPFAVAMAPDGQDHDPVHLELRVQAGIARHFRRQLSNLGHPDFYRTGIKGWIPADPWIKQRSPINEMTVASMSRLINASNSSQAFRNFLEGHTIAQNEFKFSVPIVPGMSGSPWVSLGDDGVTRVKCLVKAVSPELHLSWCTQAGVIRRMIIRLAQRTDLEPQEAAYTSKIRWHTYHGATFRQGPSDEANILLREAAFVRINAGGATRADGGGATRADGGGATRADGGTSPKSIRQPFADGFKLGNVEDRPEEFDQHVWAIRFKQGGQPAILMPAMPSTFEFLAQRRWRPETAGHAEYFQDADNPIPLVMAHLQRKNMLGRRRLFRERIVPIRSFQRDLVTMTLRAAGHEEIRLQVDLPGDRLDVSLRSDWSLHDHIAKDRQPFSYHPDLVSARGKRFTLDLSGLLFVNAGNGLHTGFAKNLKGLINEDRLVFHLWSDDVEYVLFNRLLTDQHEALERILQEGVPLSLQNFIDKIP